MAKQATEDSDSAGQDHAYLVVRDGNAWRDVFRITADRVVTIGRSSDNRIVVPDDLCSRRHCEVFAENQLWKLRDLNSRNGTMVSDRPVQETVLRDGDVIGIGDFHLQFATDINEEPSEESEQKLQSATVSIDSPEILDRRSVPSFRDQESEVKFSDNRRLSEDLGSLYRLALEMGDVFDVASLCRRVLNLLAERTHADIGAILLVPREAAEGNAALSHSQFEQVAFHGPIIEAQSLSDSLSDIVLKSREAVLANDIADDSRLSGQESLSELQARSVICAPLRREDRVIGLVHLYVTNPQRRLDTNSLDFTLAVADQLAVTIHQKWERDLLARHLTQAESENRNLKRQLRSEMEIIGDSSEIRQLKAEIMRVAPTSATVLVRGESGVGKELVARAIHANSERADGPMVCVNCAALAESLLESELFGHEKGAFTGATAQKTGKFEQADGGTLFLDEVGEMPPAIQAKFLRAMEGHPFERVGGSRAIRSDVRIVAATNRDLEGDVRKGTFRSDLYFRLNVVMVEVQPLRARRGDIELLARHFIQKFASRSGREIRGLAPETRQMLVDYDWPGNVRELQNAVERAVIMCETGILSPRDFHLSELGQHRLESESSQMFEPKSLSKVEQQHIMSVLNHTEGNKSRAAQILGIERSTLDRKLKKYQSSDD
ncbi:sigma 54-interacting transcriptional regulator [Calycomorphotria hydatis]|nr:sigma 54-interacting transcriptional regulator [Calycomorphotria hydatis]